jgi:hypothetical protein
VRFLRDLSREAYSGSGSPSLKNLAVFLAFLAVLAPLTAQAQTYYYTGRNPATPEVNDATSAIGCDADSIGVIRYNTGNSKFEGCNGAAWADIRNGATATPAGSNTQVQFNSGGAFSGSANFTWTNATSTLGVTGRSARRTWLRSA